MRTTIVLLKQRTGYLPVYRHPGLTYYPNNLLNLKPDCCTRMKQNKHLYKVPSPPRPRPPPPSPLGVDMPTQVPRLLSCLNKFFYLSLQVFTRRSRLRCSVPAQRFFFAASFFLTSGNIQTGLWKFKSIEMSPPHSRLDLTYPTFSKAAG